MASGFGLKGGMSRCYPFWMDFSECMSKTDDPVKCKDFCDDYLECLHHRKEYMRVNAIHRESERQKQEGKPGQDHHGH
ncbi:hypothetical protein WJX84_008440 [Apatococcus fuscideae]|uniref:NADH dehydrogenase [ubiquinone] iron-sulfur protein 5 n=1 Tax=Apatococcus fuscideae TaxID=2026836 RepID=A0AAW1SM18_9CHLO